MEIRTGEEGAVIRDILSAIDKLDQDTLKATLAYLIKIYVIDKGLSYEGYVSDETSTTGDAPKTFAELVTGLKERYPMDELKSFHVEGQNVFVSIDGKRYRIAQDKRSSLDTPPDRIIANNPMQKKNRPGDSKNPSDGRFGKLELD